MDARGHTLEGLELTKRLLCCCWWWCCRQMGVELGEEVGYRIGQEGLSSGLKTRILFATAGWLLQL